MNYREEKKKTETIFGRELSDREYAEALLHKIEYMKTTYKGVLEQVLECLSDSANDIDSYKEELEIY